MRLGLVFNPFTYKIHEENLRIVQKYFGLFPPLSLCWAAGIAESAGHEVELIDARTLRLTKEEALERLKEFKPDLIGMMMTTYMFRETLEWLDYFKKELNVETVVGGYNLRVYPKESVTPPEVDYGVYYSALKTLPALMSELEGDRRFSEVPGLVYKEKEDIKLNPGPNPPEKFTDYPFPARHLLPNELYAEFPTERKNFTVMVTSKGCPYQCRFCEAGRTPHDPRRPDQILAEIKECYERYGIREIDIFDYEFAVDNDRVRAICEGIIREGLDIIWACRTRIDSVNPEILEVMKKSGCSRIYYGIESGDQAFLDRMSKGITVEEIKKTIRNTRDVGIRPLGFFLVGSEGETISSIKRTIKFAKSLNLDYVQFSKTTAKPLTRLWTELTEQTGFDYWREYILGNVEEQELPRPWTELTNDQIDFWTRKAYIKFHARFRFLLRSTFKVRSFKEFRRKFLAFVDMVFFQEKRSKKARKFVAYHDHAGKLWWYRKISKWSLPF